MQVRHKFNSFIPMIFMVDAITLYPFIFYRLKAKETPITLVAHELCHIYQIKRLGALAFYFSYLLEFLLNLFKGLGFNQSYMEISFEKEAYKQQYSLELYSEAAKVLGGK